jgi:hypothetical protein
MNNAALTSSHACEHTPNGFELWDVNHTNTYSSEEKLLSLEVTFGLPNVPPGEEKYIVPESEQIILVNFLSTLRSLPNPYRQEIFHFLNHRLVLSSSTSSSLTSF